MARTNVPATQWREQDSATVDPGVEVGYPVLNADGRWQVDTAGPAEGFPVKDGNGRWQLDDSGPAEGSVIKTGGRWRVLG